MGQITRMTEAEKNKISAIIELYTAVQSEGSRESKLKRIEEMQVLYEIELFLQT